MLIDAYLPRYSFREHHAVEVAVPPSVAYRAVKEMRSDEIALMDHMFFVRRLPGKVRDRFHSRPDGLEDQPRVRTIEPAATSTDSDIPRTLLTDAVGGGFILLGEDPGREVVLGLVGKFWAFFGSPSLPMDSPRDYLAFAQPGYARTAWNFTVRPLNGGQRSLVATETRVWVADRGAWARFGLYWATIYPGSALMRRMMLRAAKLRAERGCPAARLAVRSEGLDGVAIRILEGENGRAH